MNDPVVRVAGIRKSYGPVVAVDDVSFEVRRGEIFGLVGPNGAGKTTTMECVEGLRRPDRGRIAVLSLDPMRDGRALQQRALRAGLRSVRQGRGGASSFARYHRRAPIARWPSAG